MYIVCNTHCMMGLLFLYTKHNSINMFTRLSMGVVLFAPNPNSHSAHGAHWHLNKIHTHTHTQALIHNCKSTATNATAYGEEPRCAFFILIQIVFAN